MTIDEHIEVLKSYHHGFIGYAGNLQDSIDVAVDIMCKYQKIKQIANDKNINGDLLRMSEIRWVLEDGSENNHNASNT